MAISAFSTSHRARSRNTKLHNQLLVTKKLLDKEQDSCQRQLDDRSKDCIDTIRRLQEDAKKLQRIDKVWHLIYAKKISTKSNATRKAASASIRREISNVDKTKYARPSTAKSTHVYKFAKIESLVPDTDVFQVHCHRVKEPVSLKLMKSNARGLVPRNMCKFEDDANWHDILRTTKWLDDSARRGRELSLDTKSPIVVAEFVDPDKSPSSQNDEKLLAIEQYNDCPFRNSEDHYSNYKVDDDAGRTNRSKRWETSLKQIMLMNSAVDAFSHTSAVNLEMMLKTHDREMKKSGLRSALQSKRELETAKAMSHTSGMEPMSDRELKQKILVAKSALHKDIAEAKMAKHRYKEKLFEQEKLELRNKKVPRGKKSAADSTNESSSDEDVEEFDLFKTTVLPNLRISDEMEKRVALYLEKHGIKSNTTKSNVVTNEKSFRHKRKTTISTANEIRDKNSESDVDWHINKKRERNLINLLQSDEERRLHSARITTASLLSRLREMQVKFDRLNLCRKDLEASVKRIDRNRVRTPITNIHQAKHILKSNINT